MSIGAALGKACSRYVHASCLLWQVVAAEAEMEGTEIRLTVMHRRRSEKAPHMVNLDTMPMDSFKQDKRYPLYTGIFTQASSGKKQNKPRVYRSCSVHRRFIADTAASHGLEKLCKHGAHVHHSSQKRRFKATFAARASQLDHIQRFVLSRSAPWQSL